MKTADSQAPKWPRFSGHKCFVLRMHFTVDRSLSLSPLYLSSSISIVLCSSRNIHLSISRYICIYKCLYVFHVHVRGAARAATYGRAGKKAFPEHVKLPI